MKEVCKGERDMRSAEAPEDARVRVLLAEDHALVRDGIRELLERQSDIEVVGEAADGEEAVQLARQLQPDIVLMDITMPRLSGVEATRLIKQSSPHIAILVLSAYDDDAYVFALFEVGVAGYLLKSAKSSEVVEAVRAVWQGDSPLHPSIARKVLRRLQPSSGHPTREALSGRERELLRLVACGMPNHQIAMHLTVSVRTVQSHLSHIFTKLGAASRTEAVIIGLREGWLQLEELDLGEETEGGGSR